MRPVTDFFLDIVFPTLLTIVGLAVTAMIVHSALAMWGVVS
jgi:hypothetical protein